MGPRFLGVFSPKEFWPQPFSVWRSDLHYHDVRIIDPHRTCLSGEIPSKTAPAPLLTRRHQPALNRVAMDIAKLFHPLALRPNIEIIKPRLPESVRMNWRAGAPGLADFARPFDSAQGRLWGRPLWNTAYCAQRRALMPESRSITSPAAVRSLINERVPA